MPDAPDARYIDRGPLGAGGMGEVRRVYDRTLQRAVALKTLRPELLDDARARARFEAEATMTAGLTHPGIVPVHDRGVRADGCPWYTMKLVEGRTLGRALAEGLSQRRAVEAFARVCEAMAYAHARGVIHRDIKPDNIMLGAFGEVLLMDWGIARAVATAPGEAPEPDASEPARPLELSGDATAVDRRPAGALADGLTGPGAVVGTAIYLAPEQFDPRVGPLGPPTDVYALGGTLLHIISGRAPWPDAAAAFTALIEQRAVQVDAGPPPLRAIAATALSRSPAARHADAGALAAAVRRWLDGEARRERARELLAEADRFEPRSAELRAAARALDAEADDLLGPLPSYAPAGEKAPGWALQAAAEQRRRDARLADVRYVQAVQLALRTAPDLPEARARLSAYYRRRLSEAESARETDTAAEYAELLRSHDPAGNAEWLRGDGRLTLVTDPPDATARLGRVVLEQRRMVPVFDRVLPSTPMHDHPLAMGSHVIELSAPGRCTAIYPVHIARGGSWDGRRPGEEQPSPIHLPPVDALDGQTLYVPAGWFVSGDPRALDGLPPRRVWVDAFAIRRHPVTNADYIEWLDRLVEQGRADEAASHAPRALSITGGEHPSAYRRDGDGRFMVGASEGMVWHRDGPVGAITWASACAYAAWRARRDGVPWRLPHSLEWEKAAGGVDGRRYPWGDVFEPTWAMTARSRPGRPTPVPIGEFPEDVGPYGMRGAAGNVRDMCLDRYRRTGPRLVGDVLDPLLDRASAGDICLVKGGCYASADEHSLIGARFGFPVDHAATAVGFRLARSLPLGAPDQSAGTSSAR